jgi:hypothetical protein
VSELGFRFRPSVQADLEAHAHAIRLLTEDLADVPASLLEQAAQRWAATKPYLPKACELIEMAKQCGVSNAPIDLQDYCNRMNASGGALYYYVVGEAPNRSVEWKRRSA